MGKRKVGGKGVDWEEKDDFYDKVFTSGSISGSSTTR